MTRTNMDRARLAAFVDGELDPEEAAAVVMHLADSPEGQAVVDDLMALNEMLAAAYEEPLNEPAPRPILNAIIGESGGETTTSDEVVAFPRAAPSRISRPLWFGGGALAASFAAFVFFTGLEHPAPVALTPGPIAVKSSIGEALDQLASGESRYIGDDIELSVRASFATASKGVCREFEIAREGRARLEFAIACPGFDEGAGWRIEAAGAFEANAPTDAIAPASSAIVDPIGDFLDEAGAGSTLTRQEEAQARAAQWRGLGADGATVHEKVGVAPAQE